MTLGQFLRQQARRQSGRQTQPRRAESDSPEERSAMKCHGFLLG